MGFIVFLVFALIWYLPIFLKHRKNIKEPKKLYIAAFYLGIVAFFLAAVVQLVILFGESKLFGADGRSPMLSLILDVFNKLIVIALCEELLKYAAGRIVTRKASDLTEGGLMTIMGMVGVGFEFMESSAATDILSGVIRGLTPLHIFFQLWMGKYMWHAFNEKKQGNEEGYKKYMRKAMVFPIIAHFIYDFCLFRGSNYFFAEDDNLLFTGAAFILVALITAIFVSVKCMRTSIKTLKAEAERR